MFILLCIQSIAPEVVRFSVNFWNKDLLSLSITLSWVTLMFHDLNNLTCLLCCWWCYYISVDSFFNCLQLNYPQGKKNHYPHSKRFKGKKGLWQNAKEAVCYQSMFVEGQIWVFLIAVKKAVASSDIDFLVNLLHLGSSSILWSMRIKKKEK